MLDTEVQAREPIRRELQDAVSRFLDTGGKIQKSEIVRRDIMVTAVNRGQQRTRYSEDEVETMRLMHRQGATITEIANKLGRHRQSVSHKMRHEGITTLPPSTVPDEVNA